MGNFSAIAEMFAKHYDFVWRSSRRLGVASADLDDVVQDTFVIAMAKVTAAQVLSVERAWIYAIVRNVAANHRRKHAVARRESDFVEADVVGVGPCQETVVATHESVAELDAWLAELPAEQREAFTLVRLEDFSAEEAAEVLGVRASTVSSRVQSAKQHLQRRFEQRSAREVHA